MTTDPTPNATPPRSNSDSAVHKRQRSKNLAMLGALLAFVVLIFIISIVRMSAGIAS